jgi:hypothetical protein
LIAKYNSDGRVTRAVQHAFDLASTAIEVLDTSWNHPRVQAMLNHIMRGGDKQITDIVRAKGKTSIPRGLIFKLVADPTD